MSLPNDAIPTSIVPMILQAIKRQLETVLVIEVPESNTVSSCRLMA